MGDANADLLFFGSKGCAGLALVLQVVASTNLGLPLFEIYVDAKRWITLSLKEYHSPGIKTFLIGNRILLITCKIATLNRQPGSL